MHVAVGLGIGLVAVVSRVIGEGDHRRVRRLTSDGLTLANTVVIMMAVAGFVSIEPLFRALGAGDDLIPLIKSYMVWLYGGIGLLVIPIVGNSAIRATGDTKTPAIIMAVAGLVNIALDPFLIFGIGPFPRLELQGAAIATVISWGVTFIAAFWILGRRLRMIDFRIPRPAEMWRSWKAILYVGVPASATQVLVPVAAGIVTRIVSGFGPVAVAAFGVGTRVEAFAMIGVFSLGAGLAPFIGQNYGARNCDRLRRAIRFCGVASVIFGAAFFLILAALARPIATLFSDQEEVVAVTVRYLRIMPIGYAFHGFVLLIISAFNALNRPITSAILNLFRLFIFGIPLAYLGARFVGVAGVFWGLVFANAVTALFAYGAIRKVLAVIDDEMGGVALN
jgi:putative MATE family efflux protein